MPEEVGLNFLHDTQADAISQRASINSDSMNVSSLPISKRMFKALPLCFRRKNDLILCLVWKPISESQS